ncbi:hypothetical protein PMIN04_006099 [Paraphaeosphaeria minitans]
MLSMSPQSFAKYEPSFTTFFSYEVDRCCDHVPNPSAMARQTNRISKRLPCLARAFVGWQQQRASISVPSISTRNEFEVYFKYSSHGQRQVSRHPANTERRSCSPKDLNLVSQPPMPVRT